MTDIKGSATGPKDVRKERASKARADIENLRKTIKGLNEKRDSLQKELKDFAKNLSECENENKKLVSSYIYHIESAKRAIQDDIKRYNRARKYAMERAEYEGKEFVEDEDLKKLHAKGALQPQKHPFVLQNLEERKDIERKIAEMKNRESVIPAEAKEIDKQISLHYKKISTFEKFAILDEMYDDYVEYAKDYEIDIGKTDDDNIGLSKDEILIKRCNEHHQENLLNGWHSDKVCCHCEGLEDEGWNNGVACTGWTVGNHRCDCGNYKGWRWDDDDFDPLDLNEFNIHHTAPYGRAEAQW